MRRIFLSFVLITCIITAYGQQHQIRQLEQQIANHPQQDTFKVNRLNKLALIVSVSAGKRDTLSTEAIVISRKIGYTTGEGFGLINKGMAASALGSRAQIPGLLKQVRAIIEKNGDQELLSMYWILQGREMAQIDNRKALAYYLRADSIAERLHNKTLTVLCQRIVSSTYGTVLGDFPKGMEWILKSIKTAEEGNLLNDLAGSWAALGSYYTTIGDNKNGLIYYKKALEANKTLDNTDLSSTLYNNIGERYRLMGNYPEAIKAYKQELSVPGLTPYLIELVESNMADVYVRSGNLPMAFKYGFHSLKLASQIDDNDGIAWIDGILGRAYNKANKPDSALYYASKGLKAANGTGTIEFIRDNYGALFNAYAKKNDFANAYKYQGLYVAYRDSMVSSEVSNKASLLQYNYDLAKKQAQIASLSQEKRMQYYFLAGSFGILLIIGATGVILLKNNRQKQKANLLLSKQKKEIEEQRDQTDKALTELQQTQAQLVQREKMASLGELTAGIAHEIQNPLNFVNNFSEVSIELLTELKEEEKKGNKEDVINIADDLTQNLEKIRHHGKRADFIVKGMLQHSRTSTGERQPTNINVLADEFFKLSYHGLRAKDKSFNAELTTNFDEKLPPINVVQQDVGRVLLNLFNNAFYAVNQKSKTAENGYKPEVTVSTSSGNGQIIVKVKDNGVGIPDPIKEKILQPFFTTKPAGEGTGLGLSLSYDILVKGHNGILDIVSKEGQGSEFIVKLPVA